MTVRPATTGDAEAIATVHVRSWQAAYRGLVPDENLDGLSVERRTEFWSRLLRGARRPDQEIWVAPAEGNATGFACAGDSRDEDTDPATTGELQAIYLLPDAWGRGLGYALHEACIAHLRRRGHRDATLWVLEGNVRAMAFYERQGWRPDGTAKHEVWDGTPMDEIRYRREL